MRTAVDDLLDRCGRVASRSELLTVLTRAQLDDEIRRGRLSSPFRRVYCRPWDVDEPGMLDRAALLSVGHPSRLSHLSALHCHDLLDRPPQVHVAPPAERVHRPQSGLVVHRVAAMTAPRERFAIATAAAAVVTSWPLLREPDERAPVIKAVRGRTVGAQALIAELGRHPTLAGRRDLHDLLPLLAAGCESELEIWGRSAMFDVPGLRHAQPQYRIVAGSRAFRLDLGYTAERVAMEMDGDRWHCTREQRERDRRRDALLASVGWLTLRFSWWRLHHDIDGCRRETLATLAARR